MVQCRSAVKGHTRSSGPSLFTTAHTSKQTYYIVHKVLIHTPADPLHNSREIDRNKTNISVTATTLGN